MDVEQCCIIINCISRLHASMYKRMLEKVQANKKIKTDSGSQVVSSIVSEYCAHEIYIRDNRKINTS